VSHTLTPYEFQRPLMAATQARRRLLLLVLVLAAGGTLTWQLQLKSWMPHMDVAEQGGMAALGLPETCQDLSVPTAAAAAAAAVVVVVVMVLMPGCVSLDSQRVTVKYVTSHHMHRWHTLLYNKAALCCRAVACCAWQLHHNCVNTVCRHSSNSNPMCCATCGSHPLVTRDCGCFS